MTTTADLRQARDAQVYAGTDDDRRRTQQCGGDAYPHNFVTEQEGTALARIVCTHCGTVRIEQQLDRNLVLTWSRADYEIADRFYRELVS